MNFALSALVIFVLALPGIVFRRAFLRGVRGLPVTPRTLTDEVAFSIGGAALLHGLWGGLLAVLRDYVFTQPWAHLQIDIVGTGLLVLGHFGDQDERLITATLDTVRDNIVWDLAYMGALCAVAGFMGVVLHDIVSRRPDLRERWLFGLNSHWHRLLVDGEFAASNDHKRTSDFLVFVDAVVELGDQAYIYHGLLKGQTCLVFDTGGELDQLILFAAERRKLCDDKKEASEPSRFYPINGTVFVLRYSQIKTLNVTYVQIVELHAAMHADTVSSAAMNNAFVSQAATSEDDAKNE